MSRNWSSCPPPQFDTTQNIEPPHALQACLYLPARTHYYGACSARRPPYVITSPRFHHRHGAGADKSFGHGSYLRPPTPQTMGPWPSTGTSRDGIPYDTVPHKSRSLNPIDRPRGHRSPALPQHCHPQCTHIATAPAPCLKALLRELRFPRTLQLRDSCPQVLHTIHPLYHTNLAPSQVARGFATMHYCAADMTVGGHHSQPSRCALVPHVTDPGVTYCHGNVYCQPMET